MSKHTKGQWSIVTNTDNVDIDANCIGLSPRRSTIPQDVWDHIATNRGLHIQIRHNKDGQAFAQANELARLIAAAPELLEALKAYVTETYASGGFHSGIKEVRALQHKILKQAEAAIAKAEGNGE